jgi:hypothetical protein
MKMKRLSDGKIFNVESPKRLPTKEQMQEADVTASFVELKDPEAPEQGNILVVFAPFAEKQEYEVLEEET